MKTAFFVSLKNINPSQNYVFKASYLTVGISVMRNLLQKTVGRDKILDITADNRAKIRIHCLLNEGLKY
jgi:hypothetical protein